MYKILVLRNDKLPLSDSFDKVKAFMSLNKINVSFDFKEVKELTSVHEYKVIDGFRKDNGQPSKVSLMGLDDITKDNCRNYVKEGEYQCVIFSWDTDKLQQTLMPTETVSNFAHFKPLYPTTEFIQVAVNQYSLDKNTVWSTVAHELMHTFSYFVARRLNLPLTAFDEMDVTKDGKPYYKNDTPEAKDGNFALTFNNLKPYLDMINNVPTYKHFSRVEVEKWKLQPELWLVLDKVRELAGIPINITSGLRSKTGNLLAGGAMKSTHLEGLGCDISCTDSDKRYKLLKALLDAGFKRIGVYKSHIHADLGGKEYPQPVIWFNEKE